MPFSRRAFLATFPVVLAGITAATGVAMAAGIDAALKARIKAITNVFEVGKPQADYVYVEDLNDGRGFTVTNYGFVTKEREVAQVIAKFAAKVPDSALVDFLPRLPPKARGADTRELKDFPAAWMAAAKDSTDMAEACEAVADALYFNPAMKAAESFGMASPLGRAIVYDTALQHGDGDDHDSLRAIFRRTKAATSGVSDMAQADFLFAFLEVRRDVLLKPADKATEKGWRESVTRVDALQNILAENPGLEGPIRVRNSEIDVTVS
jgi:chitosanase